MKCLRDTIVLEIADAIGQVLIWTARKKAFVQFVGVLHIAGHPREQIAQTALT